MVVMERTWTETAAGPIVAKIDGAQLRASDGRSYRLAVGDVKPMRQRIGWLYLAIAMRDDRGRGSRTPLAIGIVSGGGRLVMPWFELRIYPTIEREDGTIFDARRAGLEAGLIDLLGTLIPPGGHVMIEYESPGQSATHAELLLRVPPAATHLGFLMFQAGFRGAFKDWYISEGGHEGPRKLQANKSPTPAAARVAIQAHLAELGSFIKRALPQDEQDAALIRGAQVRARAILKELRRK
jgi:hypothetical protein